LPFLYSFRVGPAFFLSLVLQPDRASQDSHELAAANFASVIATDNRKSLCSLFDLPHASDAEIETGAGSASLILRDCAPMRQKPSVRLRMAALLLSQCCRYQL
jgi:hypothetical protein